jgi:hypothetical protein
MSEHTKEPWHTTNNGVYSHIKDAERASIGDTCASSYLGYNTLSIANAERIVACVNACAGIENSKLLEVSYAEIMEVVEATAFNNIFRHFETQEKLIKLIAAINNYKNCGNNFLEIQDKLQAIYDLAEAYSHD